jgi:hypothetical protein
MRREERRGEEVKGGYVLRTLYGRVKIVLELSWSCLGLDFSKVLFFDTENGVRLRTVPYLPYLRTPFLLIADRKDQAAVRLTSYLRQQGCR